MIEQMEEVLEAIQSAIDERQLSCSTPKIHDGLLEVHKALVEAMRQGGLSSKEVKGLMRRTLGLSVGSYSCRIAERRPECPASHFSNALYETIQAVQENDAECAQKAVVRVLRSLKSARNSECTHPEAVEEEGH